MRQIIRTVPDHQRRVRSDETENFQNSWISGHVGIARNDTADEWANKGCQL